MVGAEQVEHQRKCGRMVEQGNELVAFLDDVPDLHSPGLRLRIDPEVPLQ